MFYIKKYNKKIVDVIKSRIPIKDYEPVLESELKEAEDFYIEKRLASKRIDTLEKYKMFVRKQRNHLIENTMWVAERHSQEIDLIKRGLLDKPTLSEKQFEKWLIYWQKLRDFPNTLKNIPKDQIEPNYPKKP